MKSEAEKIAKIQARKEITIAGINAVSRLASNPVVELVGCVLLIETLQRFPAGQPILSSRLGTAVEITIPVLLALQQMAPYIPAIIEATGKSISGVIGDVKSIAPIAALAAA